MGEHGNRLKDAITKHCSAMRLVVTCPIEAASETLASEMSEVRPVQEAFRSTGRSSRSSTK